MRGPSSLKFDEIGYWSEVKLEIIQKYAKAYSTILTARKSKTRSLSHVYIDGFSGAGIHVSRETGMVVPGSPLNALQVEPKFDEYYFIDLNGEKVDFLRNQVGDRPDVHCYEGDCNEVLLKQVFPKVRWDDYRRGLCLLDPYGLHLNWEVVHAAGSGRTIDMFLNFPIADMNRNVFWKNPEGVDPGDIARMDVFWGDNSWRRIAYEEVPTLFGPTEEKANHRKIVEAYKERLKDIAGFSHVAEPLPMRNSTRGIVYYLFFASQRQVASNIVRDIFKRYKDRMA